MHIHFFQHVSFEGPAHIQTWAESRGHATSLTRWCEAETPPSLDSFDWLVALGGPMSVNDVEEYPWLAVEKQFMREAFEAGKPYVGVCLGAQLAADVLGGQVYPNQVKEIGWSPLVLTEAGATHPLFQGIASGSPAILPAFHWHGETFDLPSGAVHLACSDVCRHQAFIYRDQVLALQFHWDYEPEGVEQMLAHCAHELEQDSPAIQSADEIRAELLHVQETMRLMERLLDNFAKLLP